MNDTEITRINFIRYHRLKERGEVDMTCVRRVQSCTWLGTYKILEIMNNYEKYKAKFLRVVNP